MCVSRGFLTGNLPCRLSVALTATPLVALTLLCAFASQARNYHLVFQLNLSSSANQFAAPYNQVDVPDERLPERSALAKIPDMPRNQLEQNSFQLITVEEFAGLARISRRTLDRYRRSRPAGFPAEYDLGRGAVPRPRFKLEEVQTWLDSRALW